MAGSASMQARNVLWYVVFTGFAVNYMGWSDINIAIVSMVEHSNRELNNISHHSECFSHFQNSSATSTKYLPSDKLRFQWDEKQQGLILGAFFWFNWLSQLPGGMLAQRYGTKLVFGLSNGLTCLLAFIIPLCARLDYRVLVAVRAFQGLIWGTTWPSMHTLIANWIPPNERSKFVTAYLGSSVGTAITYPMYGLIISWFGWPAVFYTTGTIGTIWIIAWWNLVYDTPAQHPRISRDERAHILHGLGDSINKEKPPIPWKKVLTSRPVWINVLANWGNLWGVLTLMTQGPTYFKFVHGWGIEMVGLLSGIPHMCRMIFAYLVSIVGDYLLRENLMTRTNVRKLATAIGCIGPGLFSIGVAVSGCNTTSAIVNLTIAIALSGSVSTGYIASFIDLSPNFASVLFGFSSTICVLTGFISPTVVGAITYENQSVGQWMSVFLITAAMLMVTGFLYVCFSVSELQEWNSTPQQPITMKVHKYKYDEDDEEVIHETKQ